MVRKRKMGPGSSGGRMLCADRSEAKTTRCPVDICSVPTEAAAETKKIL